MTRFDTLFLLVVLGSLVLGGTTAATFNDQLATQELIPAIKDSLTATVESVTLEDQTLLVTVRFDNPTGSELTVHGAFFAAYDDSDRIAYGSVSLDAPTSIPPRGTTAVTFRMRLSSAQHDRIAAALDGAGFELQHQYAVSVSDTEFTLRSGRTHIEGEEQ